MLMVNNNVYNPNISGILIDNNGPQLRIGVQSVDGNIRTLVDEQIASFIELAAKYGSIDERAAQGIRDHFKHILTGLNTREQTSIDNLIEQYKTLYSQIENKLSSANSSGKKLLILVGEDHRDRKSLILELMLLDIASKLGVKNLLTETDEELLEQFKSIPLSNIESPNFSFVLKIARKLNLNLASCDPEQESHKINYKKRADAINQFVVDFNENSTCILGVGHLIDICNNEAINSQYDILAFNASNIGEEKKEYLFRKESYRKEPINFALSSPSVIQLDLKSNPYSLEYKDIKRLIKQFSADPSECSITQKALEKNSIAHKEGGTETTQTTSIPPSHAKFLQNSRMNEVIKLLETMTFDHAQQSPFSSSFNELNNDGLNSSRTARTQEESRGNHDIFINDKIKQSLRQTVGLGPQVSTPQFSAQQQRLNELKLREQQLEAELELARQRESIAAANFRQNARTLEESRGHLNDRINQSLFMPLRTFNPLRNQEQSLHVLNEQIRNCPGNIANRLTRGDILLSQGKKEEAKEDYLYVLSQYPANDHARNKLAII